MLTKIGNLDRIRVNGSFNLLYRKDFNNWREWNAQIRNIRFIMLDELDRDGILRMRTALTVDEIASQPWFMSRSLP